MATRDLDLVSTEKNARALILGLIAVFVLTAAVGSKNTRAVFLTDGSTIASKAFSASISPNNALSLSAPLSRRIANILADIGSGDRPTDNVFVYSPSGTGVAPPQTALGGLTPSAVPLANSAANDVAAPPAGALGDGLPATPVTPSGGSAATPPVQSINAPPSAGPGGTGATTPPPVVTPPVTAVPEPATWGMLLFGFFGIGAALRRRRNGCVSRLDTAAL